MTATCSSPTGRSPPTLACTGRVVITRPTMSWIPASSDVRPLVVVPKIELNLLVARICAGDAAGNPRSRHVATVATGDPRSATASSS